MQHKTDELNHSDCPACHDAYLAWATRRRTRIDAVGVDLAGGRGKVTIP